MKNGSARMTPHQIKLVQDSFAKVVPIKDAAAGMFYERLFELDPNLRSLFKGDMNEQRKKLMAMIATAVGGLNKLDEIVPAVQALGERHADYRVRPEHYETVGAALLWTLEKGLGEAFTADVAKAWTDVYGLLSSTMIEAAAKKAA